MTEHLTGLCGWLAAGARSRRMHVAIGIFVAAWLAVRSERADACSGKSFGIEHLIEDADLIVIARAVGFHDRKIELVVVETLKGPSPAAKLVIEGTETAYVSPARPKVPYSVDCRRASGCGGCYADEYRRGGEYLLIMKAGTPYIGVLEPTSEEVFPHVDDPWIKWVKSELARQAQTAQDLKSPHDRWVPRLVGQLRDPAKAVRVAAITEITRYSSHLSRDREAARIVAATLVKLGTENDVALRHRAIVAGLRLDHSLVDQPEVAAIVLDALARGDEQARSSAAVLLGYVKTPGPKVVKAVAHALTDPQASVRVAAARTLARLGKPALAARPQLRAAVSDPDPRVHAAALDALEVLGK